MRLQFQKFVVSRWLWFKSNDWLSWAHKMTQNMTKHLFLLIVGFSLDCRDLSYVTTMMTLFICNSSFPWFRSFPCFISCILLSSTSQQHTHGVNRYRDEHVNCSNRKIAETKANRPNSSFFALCLVSILNSLEYSTDVLNLVFISLVYISSHFYCDLLESIRSKIYLHWNLLSRACRVARLAL